MTSRRQANNNMSDVSLFNEMKMFLLLLRLLLEIKRYVCSVNNNNNKNNGMTTYKQYTYKRNIFTKIIILFTLNYIILSLTSSSRLAHTETYDIRAMAHFYVLVHIHTHREKGRGINKFLTDKIMYQF